MDRSPDPRRPPAIDYPPASPPPPGLTAGRYVYYAVVCAVVLSLTVVPFYAVGRFERAFADFKLQLPAPTRLVLSAYHLAGRAHAQYWVWLVPLALPFALARLAPTARRRLTVLAILGAMLLTLVICVSLISPALALIEGISGPKK